MHNERPILSEELNAREKNLVNDFYYSFFISQGNRDLQLSFLIDNARQHTAYTLPTFNRIIDLKNNISQLIPPQDHIEHKYQLKTGGFGTISDYDKEFQLIWNTFAKILGKVHFDYKKPDFVIDIMEDFVDSKMDLSEEELLEEISNRTIENDIKYMDERRFARHTPFNDLHTSFFREYILGNQATPSIGINKTLLRTSEFINKGAATLIGLDDLSKKWERKHPNLNFFSV